MSNNLEGQYNNNNNVVDDFFPFHFFLSKIYLIVFCIALEKVRERDIVRSLDFFFLIGSLV